MPGQVPSGLPEGTIAQVGELAKLYGKVDVRVMDYTLHGKRVIVPRDAKPFAISGDTYRTRRLGPTVKKPKSFRFTDLNSVWPSSTVVAMQGPQRQTIAIQSHSDSLPVREKTAAEELLHDPKNRGARTEREVAGRRVIMISSARAPQAWHSSKAATYLSWQPGGPVRPTFLCRSPRP